MDKSNLRLEDLPKAVEEMLSRLEKIEAQLDDLFDSDGTKKEQAFLNAEEASQFLDIAKGTLYKKVHEKELPVYKVGKRIFFSKEELVQWIKAGRIGTMDEIEAEAERWIRNNPRY